MFSQGLCSCFGHVNTTGRRQIFRSDFYQEATRLLFNEDSVASGLTTRWWHDLPISSEKRRLLLWNWAESNKQFYLKVYISASQVSSPPSSLIIHCWYTKLNEVEKQILYNPGTDTLFNNPCEDIQTFLQSECLLISWTELKYIDNENIIPIHL